MLNPLNNVNNNNKAKALIKYSRNNTNFVII